jgi:hypothetical protein
MDGGPMNDNDHADIVFRLAAIERMLTWIVAQEMRREGRDGLERLADELHSLLDEDMSESFPGLQSMKENVSARLDGLLSGVANELRRTKGRSTP